MSSEASTRRRSIGCAATTARPSKDGPLAPMALEFPRGLARGRYLARCEDESVARARAGK